MGLSAMWKSLGANPATTEKVIKAAQNGDRPELLELALSEYRNRRVGNPGLPRLDLNKC